MSLYIIATEDLKEFLPENGRNGGKTYLDVSEMGVPRMFTSESSAKICLGMWLAGPFNGYKDEGGWYAVQQTDPNRKLVWKDKLGVRKVCLISDQS